jgi:hypothetical protein
MPVDVLGAILSSQIDRHGSGLPTLLYVFPHLFGIGCPNFCSKRTLTYLRANPSNQVSARPAEG